MRTVFRACLWRGHLASRVPPTVSFARFMSPRWHLRWCITFVPERGRRSADPRRSLLTKPWSYVCLIPTRCEYVSAVQRSPLRGAFTYLLFHQGQLSINSHLRSTHLSPSKLRQIQRSHRPRSAARNSLPDVGKGIAALLLFPSS
jgi:hypothetical protein